MGGTPNHEKLGHSSIGTQDDFGIPHFKKPPYIAMSGMYNY